ncbi:glycosyltransferase family 4 protein [Sphingomonas sp. 1185]|uniref:glycosyltransferase family 4 protein n=1 Tax=Sphingomonas sp. 1185 TaxID=3156411 RepID=UPI00339AF82D
MQHRSVFFINHTSELGGGELSLLDYISARQGNDTVILFERGPLYAELRRRNISVEVTPGMDGILAMKRSSGFAESIKTALGGLAGICRLAKKMKSADLVYTNSQKATVIGAIAAIIARRPMIWHLHDIMTSPSFSGTARKIAIALTNRAVKLVIANSQATANAYYAIGGKKPVKVIPVGIDPNIFEGQNRKVNRLKLSKELGIGDHPILGLFGRISSWKGQDVAIEALKTISGAHLVLIGGALFGEDDYLKQLKYQASEAGLLDRVHFLGFRHDIPELLSGVDIALHCSTEPEPFGRVIVEAMMAGTPVVVTRGGGATEIATQTLGAISVPPRDPEALASAVTLLLNQPNKASENAKIAKKKANEIYSLSKVRKTIDEVISKFPTRSSRI